MTPFDIVGEAVKRVRTEYHIEVEVIEFSILHGTATFSVAETEALIPRKRDYAFETYYQDRQAELTIENMSAAIAQDYTTQWNPLPPEKLLKVIHGMD